MTRRRPKDAATDKLPAADGQAKEYLWNSMVDAIRDPAFVHDARFRILWANRAYTALAGMDGASVIGKPYWEVFPRRDGPLPACAAKMRSVPHCEVGEELSLESGQTFYSRSFALFSKNGSYHASVHILEDITERRRYEADLLYERDRLEEVERIFRLGTWEWDLENDRWRCSEQMCRLLGLASDKGSLTYELILQRVHADDRQRVDEAMQHTLRTGAAYDIVYRYLRPDGTAKIHHAAARAVTDADGCVRQIVGTCQDISETHEAEQRLKRLNRMYRTISRCNHLLVHAEDEHVLAQRVCETLIEQGAYHMAWVGYAEQDEARSIRAVACAGVEKGYLAGLNLTWADNERGSGPSARSIRDGKVQVTRDIRNDPRFAHWREEALRRGYASSVALPLKTTRGTYGFLGIYSAVADAFDAEEVELLTEAANDLAFGINTLRERAERDALSREVAYLSTYDRLTGLANRALLVDRLKQAMSYARRYGHLVAVISLDLDSFKDVNDSLGTDAGDQFLKETARRLCTCVRDNDTVARVGSDEFVLVVTEQKDATGTANLLSQILAAVREPVTLCEREVVVTASLGCSLFPSDGEDHEVLLRRANVAKYRAKDSGQDAISFFAAGLDVAAAERVALEADLRRALPRQELLLHYQPQVDLGTGAVVGVEALLRWRHPQRGMVPPSLFIPVAEKTGMILPIGEWVLRETCLQMKAWRDQGLKLESIAVNLAGSQFFQKDLPNKVQGVLLDTGLDARFLELELTESMLMEDIEATLDTLVALKRLGVRLSLDDFGTGYSSLSYLRRFPIDALKIDRSFVGEITTDPSSLAIVDAIIAMAHSMRLPVIAEGVETEGQLAALRARGCDQLQGYLFAKPLPPDELAKLVAEGKTLALPDAEETDRNRTLLIVDDEENILSALKRLLRRDGYEILTARSGEEGLEVLAKHQAGVILSDQRMPGMNGKEFLHRVMAMYPTSVRMILSGYTDVDTIMDAVNMGHIYKFISKPWDDRFLRACLKDAFDIYGKQRSRHAERQR